MSDYYPEESYDDCPLFSTSQREHANAEAAPGDAAICEVGYDDDSAAAARKRREILEALKRGPVSTYDMEHNWHRGQAAVGELRNRGHNIETERVDGVLRYRYFGATPRTKVPRTMYELYLSTPWWKQQSRLRKEMDGFACRQCGDTARLEVHHWRYRLFRESVTRDLITLCKPCHDAIHEAIKGSSVGFPKRISVEELNEIAQLPDGRGSDWMRELRERGPK